MVIQKFGIEIRKIGSTSDLYKEVDRILAAGKDTMIAQTAAHAIQAMLAVDKHLSVCTVEKVAKLTNVVIPAEHLAIYQSLHCMNWSAMLPDYRAQVQALILHDFRSILYPQETQA